MITGEGSSDTQCNTTAASLEYGTIGLAVIDNCAAGFVEFPVANQAGFIARQLELAVILNFGLSPRRAPKADVIYFAGKVVYRTMILKTGDQVVDVCRLIIRHCVVATHVGNTNTCGLAIQIKIPLAVVEDKSKVIPDIG